MRSRSSVLTLVVVALIASAVLVAPAAATGHAHDCDPRLVKVHDGTIKVLPTGVDDTENLQCALDVAASMPWAKVVLVEGDYFTSFLEAEGFHGVFKGQGLDRTTISTLPDGLDCVTRFDDVGDLFLLTFAASDVTLKGITFTIGGDAPCAVPWDAYVDEEEGWGYEDSTIGVVFGTTHLTPGETCPGTVDHRLRVYGIAVESEFPDDEAEVVEYDGFSAGVTAMPRWLDDLECARMHGSVVVRGSHIDGTIAAVRVWAHDDSAVVIGGNKPWQSNTFTDVGIGLSYLESSATDVYLRGNRMHDIHWYSVNASAGDLGAEVPNRILIAHNSISGQIAGYAIGVFDWALEEGTQAFDTAIVRNTIAIDDGNVGVFVIGTDGKIVGNRFTGSAWSGIELFGAEVWDEETEEPLFTVPSTGWYIAKNTMRGFTTEFADISLSETTAENTVICNCRHDTVVDDGVDNTIVRCNVIEPPPEPPEEPDEAAMRYRFEH